MVVNALVNKFESTFHHLQHDLAPIVFGVFVQLRYNAPTASGTRAAATAPHCRYFVTRAAYCRLARSLV